MLTKELAKRAYEDILDDEWKAAQDAEVLPPQFVSWDALNPTKRHEFLEIAEKGGDASVFGQKVEKILQLPKAEVVAAEEPSAVETSSAEIIPEEPSAADIPAQENGAISESELAEPVKVSGEADVVIQDGVSAEDVPAENVPTETAPKKKSSKPKTKTN